MAIGWQKPYFRCIKTKSLEIIAALVLRSTPLVPRWIQRMKLNVVQSAIERGSSNWQGRRTNEACIDLWDHNNIQALDTFLSHPRSVSATDLWTESLTPSSKIIRSSRTRKIDVISTIDGKIQNCRIAIRFFLSLLRQLHKLPEHQKGAKFIIHSARCVSERSLPYTTAHVRLFRILLKVPPVRCLSCTWLKAEITTNKCHCPALFVSQ